MTVLDRAIAHRSDAPRIEIDVPEWAEEGQESLTIYATSMTLNQRRKLQKLSKDDMALVARIVVLKAENENGERLFKDGEHIMLMSGADSSVVARVAEEITNNGSSLTIEEAEKN